MPANQNCGAGTTGTFPNCYPIPPSTGSSQGGGSDSQDGDGQPQGDGQEPGGGQEQGGGQDGDDPDPEPTTTTNPCEPWPSCNQSSDPKPETTTTTSNDPCGDYADDLIAALNQPNSDGSYSLPNHPEGCSGASTREMLGRVRVFGADAARLFKQAFEKAMEYQGEATENQGEMFDGIDELLTELAKLWDETPNPAKAAALGLACFFLIPAEEVSSLTPAGTAVTAAQVATCSAALGLASEIISNAASDSDDGNGQGENDGSSNDDTGSMPSTPAEWDKAVEKAEKDRSLTSAEVYEIQNQRDCAYNRPWATNCP
ncbi:MAG: hypothetical protein F4W98_02625 [Acidimicrobiales bacterium]|nr:hypothetical protein [Acidimicrobiales bacterium]